MSDDERLARELQRQFDAEERRHQAEEAASERLAQRLAASSHSMSDSDASGDSPRRSASEGGDEAEEAARPTERTKTAPEPTKTAPERTKTASERTKTAPERTKTAPERAAAGGRTSVGTAQGVRDRGDRDDRERGDRDDRERGERSGREGGERGGSVRGERGSPAGKRRHSPPAVDAAAPRDSEDGGPPAGGKRRRLPPTVSGAERPSSSPGRSGRGSPRSAPRTPHRARTVPATEAREDRSKPGTATPATTAAAVVASNGGGSRPAPRSECRYGARCFRIGNPAHTQAFSHPEQPAQPPGDAVQISSGTDNDSPAQKKRPSQKTSIADRLREAEPVSFFLTKVRSVKSTWRERLSLGIVELLDPSLGELRSSLQLNFLVDLDWLLEAYSVYGHQDKPLTVLHGIDPFSSPQSHITVQKVSMPYPFGTHHTKMMVFEYVEGLRVVIHTSNLVDDDWRDKTQGLWVSPLLPPLGGDAADAAAGEAPTGFRADLSRYLSAYKLRCLTPWLEKIARHDFSAVRVFFVSSVPGRFQGAEMARWGHFRVRRLLQTHAVRRSWDLVIQCSSIGRLGDVPEQWLLGQFRESLTGGPSSARTTVIYPTEENVRTSVEGYDGGSCLPYHHKTHVQQLWLREYLHQWRSERRGRSAAMPHIKTYAQLSADRQRLAWFMLTSANLSKAAWGATEKQGQQVFIRSYEAGVLYLPKLLGCEHLTVLTGDTAVPGCVSLPYSLPLTPYGDGDKPWFADTAHPRPDPMGRMLVRK